MYKVENQKGVEFSTLFGVSWGIGIISGVIAGFGTAVLIGIAGAVAIYYLGEFLDGIWESFKEQIFG